MAPATQVAPAAHLPLQALPLHPPALPSSLPLPSQPLPLPLLSGVFIFLALLLTAQPLTCLLSSPTKLLLKGLTGLVNVRRAAAAVLQLRAA